MSNTEPRENGQPLEPTRRDLLEPGTIARAAAASVAAAAIAGTSRARAATCGPRLVVLNLRGGADGLTWVAPYLDSIYQTKRDLTQVLPPGSGDPGKSATQIQPGYGVPGGPFVPTFGIPRALLPLKDVYDANKLVFVHACGVMEDNRSHFEMQSRLEVGFSPEGWVKRFLDAVPACSTTSSLRAVSFGALLPEALRNGDGAFATPDPADLSDPFPPGLAPTLSGMYDGFGTPLADVLGRRPLGPVDPPGDRLPRPRVPRAVGLPGDAPGRAVP